MKARSLYHRFGCTQEPSDLLGTKLDTESLTWMSDDWPSNTLPEYSVSELSTALKRSVEDQFGYVRVRAELSGVKLAASGHMYFALKDDKSVLDGVSWRGSVQKLSFRPEDGLEVICSGKLTTYAARSKYQMVVDHMEPAGAGALMALLEERRKKLAAEGLFDQSRKKRPPYLPRTIGVVTSPTGAVIRDILHRLADRFPRRVIVWPVLVQGEGAASQVAKAVRGFNDFGKDGAVSRPDLLIVARGGGSIEDLWSFNEEEVVRAVADSDIPVISAVGHETDTTLVDHAADLRAPTPTGAAEIAVPVREELVATVSDLGRRLAQQRQQLVQSREEKLRGLVRALPKPTDLLGLAQQRFDDLCDRLPRALSHIARSKESQLNRVSGALTPGRLHQLVQHQKSVFGSVERRLAPAFARTLEERSQRLGAAARILGSLSYERVLDRGFALVMDGDGQTVSSVEALTGGDEVSLRFADGERSAVVTGEGTTKPAKPASKPARKQVSKKGKDTLQGSLF